MPRWPLEIERYRSYVRPGGVNECWPWCGPLDSHGYGQLHWGGRLRMAGIVTLMIQGIEFGAGECALHTCDNPPCVNPAHLFKGTKQDNSNDMKWKGRERKALGDQSGSRKHPEKRPRGERNTEAKLTADQVQEIRASHESGSVLAARYGVHRSTVNRARAGVHWGHVAEAAA